MLAHLMRIWFGMVLKGFNILVSEVFPPHRSTLCFLMNVSHKDDGSECSSPPTTLELNLNFLCFHSPAVAPSQFPTGLAKSDKTGH